MLFSELERAQLADQYVTAIDIARKAWTRCKHDPTATGAKRFPTGRGAYIEGEGDTAHVSINPEIELIKKAGKKPEQLVDDLTSLLSVAARQLGEADGHALAARLKFVRDPAAGALWRSLDAAVIAHVLLEISKPQKGGAS